MIAELHTAALKAAKEELWRRKQVWPLLEVYLDRDQLADARAFFAGCDVQRGELPKDDWYDDISRQRGKSWKWCVICVVWCHVHPRQYVKYAAQLGKSVRNIIWPTIKRLVADMPKELQGDGATPIREDRTDHKWTFPNGSELLAAGMNNGHEDDLRGSATHLFVFDECAFYTDLPKVHEVCNPQTLTTKGVRVYPTTPPDSPLHPIREVREALKSIGRYVHRTIYGHPRMSPEEIDAFLEKEARTKGLTLEAFKRTTLYRREYLCMHVVEASRAVVPEWSEDAGPEYPEGTTWGEAHCADLPRPLFYDPYDALDVGFTRDPSAWLGGYYDWSTGRIVIESESPPLRRTRAEALAEDVRERRKALWPASGRPPSRESRKSPCGTYWLPYRAVGDGAGLGAEKLDEVARYGVLFLHAEKEADLETRVSRLRTLVAAGKVWVSPSCVYLRRQLATGLWADKYVKNDFERTEEGHLDHLAALVDLVNNVDTQHRPVPHDYGVDTHNTMGGRAPRNLDNLFGNMEWR